MKFEELLKESVGKNIVLSYETPSGEVHSVYGKLQAIEKEFIVIEAAISTIHVNRQSCVITELGVQH